MLLAFLLLLQGPADRARALLEQLRSDVPAERQAAARELEAIAEAVRPTLEAAAKDPEAEVREIASRLIYDLDRRRRLSVLRPPPRRLTLDLRDVPVSEAVRRLLEPSGAPPSILLLPTGLDPAMARTSVSLKHAAFWDTMDALAAALRVKLEPKYGQLACVSGTEWAASGTPEVRLWARAGRLTDSRGNATHHVSLMAQLPPGTRVLGYRLEEVDVAVNGAPSAIERRPLLDGQWCPWGDDRLTSLPLALPAIQPPEGVVPRRVDLRGELVLVFPKDVERFDFELGYREEAPERSLGPATLRTAWSQNNDAEPARPRFLLLTPPGTPAERYLGWWVDRDGRKVADMGIFDSSKNDPREAAAAGDTRARWSFLRLIGTEELRIPFSFRDLPIP